MPLAALFTLCPPSDTKDLFVHWENLVYILRPPVEAYSGSHAIPVGDSLDITGFEEEDKSPSVSLHRDSKRWGQGAMGEQLKVPQSLWY